MIYDTVIIGTGPAGVSAALNLKIHNKNILWFGSKKLSEKIEKAEEINNYPGLPAISGADLNRAFQKHVESMGLEIREQMVNAIMPMDDHYALAVSNDFFEAYTLILATGVTAVGLLPGEADFVGRGVSYCATCDGGLYRGKTVAVLATNRRFEHEVKYLSELAKEVYFFPTYKDAGEIAENVRRMEERIVGVSGEKKLSALSLRGGSQLAVDGLFCLRDSISLNTLLPQLETREGHIAVDRRMATNLPGCYAAGDCTGRPYQYTKAVGEGNVAAHSVIEYLAEREKAN